MTVELLPADLIFVRGNGHIDHAIEAVSHSPYSHVAGYVKPGELIEAQGFRQTGYAALDYYDGVADVYRCDGLTDKQRQGIVDYVKQRIGTHYDYDVLGWEAVHFLLHVNLPHHKDSEHYDCSDLWNDAYESVGVTLRPSLNGEPVAPGELAKSTLLRKIGSF